MLAKVLVVILMVRYFNNPENIRKSVTIFNLSFKLDGKSQNNPITQAIKGNQNSMSPLADNYNFAWVAWWQSYIRMIFVHIFQSNFSLSKII